MTIAQHALDLRHAPCLHHEVARLAMELLAQHRRIPIEVARELLHQLRLREDARVVAENFRKCCGVGWVHNIGSR